MRWQQEHSIGIQEIDDQHRELLIYLSAVRQSFQMGRLSSDIHQRINSLMSFAQHHFAFEEALMRLYGYSGVPTHRTEHENLFKALAKLGSHSADVLRTQEMIEKLADMVIAHIVNADRHYAEFILSGVSVVRAPAPLA